MDQIKIGKFIAMRRKLKGLTQSQLAASQAIHSFLTAKTQLEQTLGQDFVE